MVLRSHSKKNFAEPQCTDHRSCLCLCYEINDHTAVCTTSTFFTYTLNPPNKILFYSCPHIRLSAPIKFRKNSYITRKCLSRYSVSSKEIEPRTLSPLILIVKSWLATSRKLLKEKMRKLSLTLTPKTLSYGM